MSLGLKLLGILSLILLVSGCSTELNNQLAGLSPHDTFVHVEVNSISINPSETGNWVERQGFGSGIIIKSNATSTWVLTAAHVCIPSYDTSDSRDNSINTISVVNWNGELFNVDVIGLDIPNDLCMLEGGYTGIPSIRTSRIIPSPGDRIYNMAAPYNIFGNRFVLTFDGIYSGQISGENEQIYTVPAGPGSSGSPILNSNGHLIGIIHSSTTVMENIAIGPSTESIINFITSF